MPLQELHNAPEFAFVLPMRLLRTVASRLPPLVVVMFIALVPDSAPVSVSLSSTRLVS